MDINRLRFYTSINKKERYLSIKNFNHNFIRLSDYDIKNSNAIAKVLDMRYDIISNIYSFNEGININGDNVYFFLRMSDFLKSIIFEYNINKYYEDEESNKVIFNSCLNNIKSVTEIIDNSKYTSYSCEYLKKQDYTFYIDNSRFIKISPKKNSLLFLSNLKRYNTNLYDEDNFYFNFYFNKKIKTILYELIEKQTDIDIHDEYEEYKYNPEDDDYISKTGFLNISVNVLYDFIVKEDEVTKQKLFLPLYDNYFYITLNNGIYYYIKKVISGLLDRYDEYRYITETTDINMKEFYEHLDTIRDRIKSVLFLLLYPVFNDDYYKELKKDIKNIKYYKDNINRDLIDNILGYISNKTVYYDSEYILDYNGLTKYDKLSGIYNNIEGIIKSFNIDNDERTIQNIKYLILFLFFNTYSDEIIVSNNNVNKVKILKDKHVVYKNICSLISDSIVIDKLNHDLIKDWLYKFSSKEQVHSFELMIKLIHEKLSELRNKYIINSITNFDLF